ncbi:Endonuclease VIII-like 3 [Anas platyrhynchos]|uniref:DNA-(apurinic or apyrimidinic site) lyase n=1 Tax=Anas platyrhynchos TaxID=8839 RepID=R0L238_ANAPL|nr:Endonuclease VIII-like 3 [Anas platyrhynchos]
MVQSQFTGNLADTGTWMTIDNIDVTSMTNIIQMTCWAVNFPDLGAFRQSIHTVRQLTNDSSEVPVPGITTLLATEAVRLAEWTPTGIFGEDELYLGLFYRVRIGTEEAHAALQPVLLLLPRTSTPILPKMRRKVVRLLLSRKCDYYAEEHSCFTCHSQCDFLCEHSNLVGFATPRTHCKCRHHTDNKYTEHQEQNENLSCSADRMLSSQKQKPLSTRKGRKSYRAKAFCSVSKLSLAFTKLSKVYPLLLPLTRIVQEWFKNKVVTVSFWGCGLHGFLVKPDTTFGHSETATSEERTSVHNFLTGHVYRGVETLGKELFMYFDQKALRIHFGMNGSMRINPDGSKDRNGALPVLEIQLTEDTICFFGVTTEYRKAAESEQKVRMMESLDVCSPKFSFLRAESEIKQQKTRMLCDVLLDQTVLPGVGNIIKNEALFDSGLHPAVKVELYDDMHGYDDCPFEVSGYSCRSEDAQVHSQLFINPDI